MAYNFATARALSTHIANRDAAAIDAMPLVVPYDGREELARMTRHDRLSDCPPGYTAYETPLLAVFDTEGPSEQFMDRMRSMYDSERGSFKQLCAVASALLRRRERSGFPPMADARTVRVFRGISETLVVENAEPLLRMLWAPASRYDQLALLDLLHAHGVVPGWQSVRWYLCCYEFFDVMRTLVRRAAPAARRRAVLEIASLRYVNSIPRGVLAIREDPELRAALAVHAQRDAGGRTLLHLLCGIHSSYYRLCVVPCFPWLIADLGLSPFLLDRDGRMAIDYLTNDAARAELRAHMDTEARRERPFIAAAVMALHPRARPPDGKGLGRLPPDLLRLILVSALPSLGPRPRA